MAVMFVAVRVLIFSRDILSSQSSDGLIREEMSIGSEFEVEGLPLDLMICLVVSILSMNLGVYLSVNQIELLHTQLHSTTTRTTTTSY